MSQCQSNKAIVELVFFSALHPTDCLLFKAQPTTQKVIENRETSLHKNFSLLFVVIFSSSSCYDSFYGSTF
jgi:hypothetical protein